MVDLLGKGGGDEQMAAFIGFEEAFYGSSAEPGEDRREGDHVLDALTPH